MKHFTRDKDLSIPLKEWMNNRKLAELSDEQMGFYIRLQHHIAACGFPYGFCSSLNFTKVQEDKDRYGLQHVSKASLWAMGPKEIEGLLAVELTLYQQLELVESIEDSLQRNLPHSEGKIAEYLKKLELAELIGRTEAGIIYVISLVRHYQKRITAHKNGKKGGRASRSKVTGSTEAGPNKSTADAVEASKSTEDLLKSQFILGLEQSSVGQKMDAGKQDSDNSMQHGKESRQGQLAIPHFDYREYYEGGYTAAKRRWQRLTEGHYCTWHRFVSYLINSAKYHEVLRAKMVEPEDFALIVAKHGFTEDKWEPVIKRMLATGIKNTHRLYFRLQDYIGYVYSKDM